MKISSKVIFDLYETMSDQKIISAYHGEFTQDVINMLLKQAKWDMHDRNIDKITQKKTYNILVECLENILKHASMIRNSDSPVFNIDGIVVLGICDSNYYITVGNLIHNSSTTYLKEKIDMVNMLDKPALKQKYREVITTTSISEKGGAGLGIIDIAMKSGNTLEYNFYPHTDEVSFFALQVMVSNLKGLNPE